MEYTIQLREDQKIILVTAWGEWDASIDNNMVYQILETIDSSGYQNVLLDLRELQFDFPVFQIFGRAKEVREQRRQFGKGSSKTALMYSPRNPKIEEDMQFFENASRNRGLPYRTFTDVEDAIMWLSAENK